jgi:hypothetical protein
VSGKQMPIYRTTNPGSTQVGRAKVVKDRNARYYVNGSLVQQVSVRGEFSRLECVDGNDYVVLTRDLEAVPGPRR